MSRILTSLSVLSLAVLLGCSSGSGGTLDGDAVTSVADSRQASGSLGISCKANADCGELLCDPIDGVCVYCTVDGHCEEGEMCIGGQCLSDVLCVPGTALCVGESEATPCNAVGTAYLAPESCDDGVACTIDACQDGPGCTHTLSDVVCDDGNDCTLEECDPVEGCLYTVAPECAGGGIADASPKKVKFPPTIPQEQVTKETVTIANIGLAELTLYSVTVHGDEAFLFNVPQGSNLQEIIFEPEVVVATGEDFKLDALFAPDALGDYSGELVIATNDVTKSGGELTIPVVGNAVADNCLEVDPLEVQFGAVPVGNTVEAGIGLTNCGDGSVPVYELSLIGNDAGVFSIVASLTPPYSLDLGQNTVLTVGFSPAKVGVAYEAKIRLLTGVPSSPVMEVTLSGEATL